MRKLFLYGLLRVSQLVVLVILILLELKIHLVKSVSLTLIIIINQLRLMKIKFTAFSGLIKLISKPDIK